MNQIIDIGLLIATIIVTFILPFFFGKFTKRKNEKRDAWWQKEIERQENENCENEFD